MQEQVIQLSDFTTKERAFEEIFNKYWEHLYRCAYKKVKSEDAAKDLVQEVFVVFWNSIENLPQDKSLLPYLYTVLKHKTLQLFEKDEVRLRYVVNVSKLEPHFELPSDNLVISKELNHIISNEVEKMPEKMREIYLLKKDQQLSISEISEMLSLSKQTVKNQLQNATLRLKTRLKYYDTALILFAITGLLRS